MRRTSFTLTCLFWALPVVALAQTNPTGAIDPPSAAPVAQVGALDEPRFIAKVIRLGNRFFGESDSRKSGFFAEASTDVNGAGWLTLGPGYRLWLNRDRVLVEGSGAWSWRSYKVGETKIEFTDLASGRLTLGSQVRWQDLTQVTYFGDGPDSRIEDRSEYRLKSLGATAYGSFRLLPSITAAARVGYLGRPELSEPAGTFLRGYPFTREMFPNDPVFSISEQPRFVHGEASLTLDTRDSHGHPTSGGVYRTLWARYRDRDARIFGFDRFEAEGAHFLPLSESRWVIGLHGWTVSTDVPAGRAVPFYLQPSLGGSTALRGFPDGRLHDRHLLLLTAEARFALFDHLDLAAFADAGNVAPRYRDLDLEHRTYGVGIRMHTDRTTFVRFDAARGPEGWRFLFRLNDSLRLRSLSKQVPAVPYTR